MMLRTLTILTVLLAFLLLVALPARTAPATVAILPDATQGLDQSQIIVRLTERLSQEAGVKLVEPADIERFLQEADLLPLMKPGTVEDRMAAGKTLNAGLLVLLHAVKRGAEEPKVRAIDLVVAETGHGARVLTVSLPWPDDTDATLEALTTQVLLGIARGSRTDAIPCTVSPFANTNKPGAPAAGYARLIEQILLSQPNLLPLEPAEAQAMDPAAKLVKISGEYDAADEGEQARLTLRLALERNGEVFTAQQTDLPTGDAGAFLLRAMDDLLGKALGAPAQTTTPDNLLSGLNTRAELATKAGDLTDALSSQQASLLLAPEKADALLATALTAARLVKANYDANGTDAYLAGKINAATAYYALTRQYLDAYRKAGQVDRDPFYDQQYLPFSAARKTIEDFIRDLRYPFGSKDTPLKQQNLAKCLEVWKAESARLLADVERFRGGDVDYARALCQPLCDTVINFRCNSGLTIPELLVYKWRGLQALEQWPVAMWRTEYPEQRNMYQSMIQLGMEGSDFDCPEYPAFVKQVSELKAPFLPELLAQIQEQVDPSRDPNTGQPLPPHSRKPLASTQEVHFTPITVQLLNPAEREEAAQTNFYGWLCCSETEVLWRSTEVFVMKAPGEIKRVFRTQELDFWFLADCFDGKYAWLPYVRKTGSTGRDPLVQDTGVVVVDPVSEQTWRFTPQDGLPPADTMQAVGVAPGLICLAGGHAGRSWIALLSLGANGVKKLEIIHEARVQRPDNPTEEDALNINLAFQPLYMARLIAGGEPRILMGGRPRYPLIIDPKTRKVSLMKTELDIYLRPEEISIRDGAMYYYSHGDPPEYQADIMKITPDLQKTRLFFGINEFGSSAFGLDGDRVHLVNVGDRTWMTADNLQSRLIKLKGTVPRNPNYTDRHCLAVFRSKFHGLVYQDDLFFYAVEFTPLVK